MPHSCAPKHELGTIISQTYIYIPMECKYCGGLNCYIHNLDDHEIVLAAICYLLPHATYDKL